MITKLSFTLLYFFLFCAPAFAQLKERKILKIGNHQNDEVKFSNQFVKLVESDSLYNYYAVDMSVFKEKHEKIYFKNLIFNEPWLVSLDHDVEKKTSWYKATKKRTEVDVTKFLSDLRSKAINDSKNQNKSSKQKALEKYK